MAIIYQQSFSASLDDNGAQKAMPLPALNKGITYNFNVGFDGSWRSYWSNHSVFYVVYETPYNYSGSYAGQPKNASGSFEFSAVNQKFNTGSLINDDYKWAVNGAFGADNLQNPSITFTPAVDVAISESFLRVIGENDFIMTIDDLGSYIFSTTFELQAAVNLWISDNTAALATYGEINTWNTTAITVMNNLFNNKTTFNSDISNWDVSNVTTMESMFRDADSFNQPIGNWDVSSVQSMNSMFSTATSFNQPIGDWTLSSITNLSLMFVNAVSFDQPIGDWEVGNVNNMQSMFENADIFNQDISNWDVSSVTNMNSMFDRAELFNQPLNNWNVSNVTDMRDMFSQAYAFQQPLNLWTPNSLVGGFAAQFMGQTGNAGAITYTLLDTLLNGWVVDFAALQSNVTISFGDSTFTAAGLAARNILVNDKGWTITDGGQV